MYVDKNCDFSDMESWKNNDDFMSSPTEEDIKPVPRLVTDYQNKSESFRLSNKRDFQRQYAHIYAAR